VDWLVVEDKQGKTGRNNMGIFKKIMKKQPSAKAKGTIRKMLANPAKGTIRKMLANPVLIQKNLQRILKSL
jgi:hypothetical protein